MVDYDIQDDTIDNLKINIKVLFKMEEFQKYLKVFFEIKKYEEDLIKYSVSHGLLYGLTEQGHSNIIENIIDENEIGNLKKSKEILDNMKGYQKNLKFIVDKLKKTEDDIMEKYVDTYPNLFVQEEQKDIIKKLTDQVQYNDKPENLKILNTMIEYKNLLNFYLNLEEFETHLKMWIKFSKVLDANDQNAERLKIDALKPQKNSSTIENLKQTKKIWKDYEITLANLLRKENYKDFDEEEELIELEEEDDENEDEDEDEEVIELEEEDDEEEVIEIEEKDPKQKLELNENFFILQTI
jgi:hypothetical protein